jgi:small subunit ribosomal protein S15
MLYLLKLIDRALFIMISKETKTKIIKKHAQGDTDTGSPEVQVALLSEKIKELQDHLSTHKKDTHSRLGLVKMVEARRRLLKYLGKRAPARHEKLAKALKLK